MGHHHKCGCEVKKEKCHCKKRKESCGRRDRCERGFFEGMGMESLLIFLILILLLLSTPNGV